VTVSVSAVVVHYRGGDLLARCVGACLRSEDVRRELVRKHPGATKRALRAILKATDLCATVPERAARQLIEGGFAQNYDYALQVLSELPYDVWRELDPEDSLRFSALWLHDFGELNSTPNKIIADGTNWRFLDELKRELKA
jgi:NitT/TauT family transport system substrate-binding protein